MDEPRPRGTARRLFAATGRSVASRILRIEREAAQLLEAGDFDAEDRRWVATALNFCCVVCHEPAPHSLIELTRRMIGAIAQPRGRVRNLPMWRAAARHKAENPEATASQIRRAIGYDQRRTIAAWMGDPEWQAEVDVIRRELKNQLLPPQTL